MKNGTNNYNFQDFKPDFKRLTMKPKKKLRSDHQANLSIT